MEQLKNSDPQIYNWINQEHERQESELEMIASENYTSLAVMQAQGSILTNKYAEGYPSKRYYGGCQNVDLIESLAIQRAQNLFKAPFANVQAHSGSGANMAAFFALIKPQDKIMGMDLSHGGHLTHGSPVNFSGFLFEAHSYGLNPQTGLLDYDLIRSQALKVRPQLIIAGYSAYPRYLDFHAFKAIADEVGASLLVDMAHFAGLVASGHHPSPLGIADIVTTTTHKTLRGPRGGLILTHQEELAKKINSKIFPGIQGGPLEHVIAAKAVAFGEALNPSFGEYIDQVIKNAQTLATELVNQGFDLVTGGTDNHLLLIDLSKKELTGKEAETALGNSGITVNKNTVPNEKRSPFVTSGVRIGTPALTTRGMKQEQMIRIAHWITQTLNHPTDQDLHKKIKQEIHELCKQFPVYGTQKRPQ